MVATAPVTVIDVAVTPLAVSIVVATPELFVALLLVDSMPAVVVKATATPTIGLLFVSSTVAETVTAGVPVEETVDALELSVTLARVWVVPVPVPVPVDVQLDVLVEELLPALPPLKLPQPSLLPLPQPARASVAPNRAMIDANLRMIPLPKKLDVVDAPD